MPELEVILNRYDGSGAAKLVVLGNVRYDGRGPHIDVPLGDDDEFSIEFRVTSGMVDESLVEAARDLLMNVREIDNKVQAACAAECRASRLHPRNFESALAYITITKAYALLHYFGTGVNTEWDELVEQMGEVWVHRGVATQDLLARVAEVRERGV